MIHTGDITHLSKPDQLTTPQISVRGAHGMCGRHHLPDEPVQISSNATARTPSGWLVFFYHNDGIYALVSA